MAEKRFVYIVVDYDTKTFSVEGPMTDDTCWDTAVVEAKDAGRNVQCGGGGSYDDVEVAATAYAKEYGYERVPPRSIVTPEP